jgi:hypothetical protein
MSNSSKKINLEKIIAITGEPGLYRVISTSKNHFIVENILTGQRTSVSALSRISHLNEIAMYVQDGEKPLSEIFYTLYEKTNGGPAVSHKASDEEIKKSFEEILPDYDKEKVYISNMRKFFSWYNILQQSGNLKVVEAEENKDQESEIASTVLAGENEKKSSSPKKNSVKEKTVKTNSSTSKNPVRKTTQVRKSGSA